VHRQDLADGSGFHGTFFRGDIKTDVRIHRSVDRHAFLPMMKSYIRFRGTFHDPFDPASNDSPMKRYLFNMIIFQDINPWRRDASNAYPRHRLIESSACGFFDSEASRLRQKSAKVRERFFVLHVPVGSAVSAGRKESRVYRGNDRRCELIPCHGNLPRIYTPACNNDVPGLKSWMQNIRHRGKHRRGAYALRRIMSVKSDVTPLYNGIRTSGSGHTIFKLLRSIRGVTWRERRR